LTSDAVGNLTNDGKDYKYEYDAFGRLRRIKNQDDELVSAYRYNGLGYLIEIHEDTDGVNGVDDSDVWFHPVYDEGWRMVAVYRSYWRTSPTPAQRVYDSSPKEDYVLQMAGLDGRGGSSYINGVVCRNRDANSGWAAQSDGTLEERYFYCHNWRGDVAALVTSGRKLHEWGKFSPYGIPNCLPGADTNSDGDCDENDISQILAWRTAGPPAHYDVRGDVDLDHELDATDESLASGGVLGADTFLGWGVLSNTGIRNKVGYAGYVHSDAIPNSAHVRNRLYRAEIGRWPQRDSLGYVDGPSLYEYASSRPQPFVDPYGLDIGPPGGGSSGGGSFDPGLFAALAPPPPPLPPPPPPLPPPPQNPPAQPPEPLPPDLFLPPCEEAELGWGFKLRGCKQDPNDPFGPGGDTLDLSWGNY
jgi:RHS repeat-associated protein